MIGALILAAGHENEFDPLMLLGSISAVQRLISVFERAGADRIVVIGGSDFQYLERHVANRNVVCLLNEDYESTQMLDSIKMGIEYLEDRYDRVFITPVDIPLFSVETTLAMLEEDAEVVIPEYSGQTGHPLLLSSDAFPLVKGYSGGGGLESAITNLRLSTSHVKVDDRGILMDIARRDDYQDLLEQHSLNDTYPEINVYLAGEKRYFGPRIYLLLSLIDETHSLRRACEQMGVSYSKGWKMIEEMESQLGYKLVERQRGGASKGKSAINTRGKELLERYSAYTKECNDVARELYEKHFGNSAL